MCICVCYSKILHEVVQYREVRIDEMYEIQRKSNISREKCAKPKKKKQEKHIQSNIQQSSQKKHWETYFSFNPESFTSEHK